MRATPFHETLGLPAGGATTAAAGGCTAGTGAPCATGLLPSGVVAQPLSIACKFPGTFTVIVTVLRFE